MRIKTSRFLAICALTIALIKPVTNANAAPTPPFNSSPSTVNQINLVNTLLGVTTPTADQLAILTALAPIPAVPGDPFGLALDALSGEQYTSLLQLTQFTNRRFLRELYTPLSYDAEELLKHCPKEVTYERWASIGGGRAFLRNDHNAAGFKMHNYDATLGIQKYLNRNITVGAAVNYEFDHIHYYTPGSGRSHNIQGALYAMYNAPCFYLMSDLIIGWTNTKVNRLIQFGTVNVTAQSDNSIPNGIFYVEGGANLHTGVFLVRPFIGAETGYYHRGPINETGAGIYALNIQDRTQQTADSRVGVHMITKNPQCILWSADAIWHHRFNNVNGRINPLLVSFPTRFEIFGVRQHRDGFEGTVTAARQFNEYFTFYIEFSGEKWSRYSTYELSAGLLSQW